MEMTEPPEPPTPVQPTKFGELDMSIEHGAGAVTIRLAGELDVATAPRVEEELKQAEAGEEATIVLDLSGLTFMDSTGVRLVLSAHARSRQDSDRLRLVRGPHAVHRVFELSGVADTLPFVA
jgi:anti-anti-sigma factor